MFCEGVEGQAERFQREDALRLTLHLAPWKWRTIASNKAFVAQRGARLKVIPIPPATASPPPGATARPQLSSKSIFRKKPAPDLIRGECRFSERKCDQKKLLDRFPIQLNRKAV